MNALTYDQQSLAINVLVGAAFLWLIVVGFNTTSMTAVDDDYGVSWNEVKFTDAQLLGLSNR